MLKLRKNKKINVIILLIICIMLCGCKSNSFNEKKYANEMLNYLEEKYDKEFEIVRCILPQKTFNSEHLKNYLLVRELETGIFTEVYSLVSEPYVFYDYYISDIAVQKTEEILLHNNQNLINKSKLYFYMRNEDINSLDISTENISRVVLVININHSPDIKNMEQLYEIYNQLFSLEYENIFMIIGFTEENPIFDNYVKYYRIYGVKDWQDYDGKVYATMDINETNLTYEQFKNKIIFN